MFRDKVEISLNWVKFILYLVELIVAHCVAYVLYVYVIRFLFNVSIS